MKAPINVFKPRSLSEKEIERHISDYVNCAFLAQQAGYDGIEIIGSEGYLINQFIVSKTNYRTDGWGGSYENRIRFPVEIVRQTREKVGSDFIIIYRLSMLDLVENGSSWGEVGQRVAIVGAGGIGFDVAQFIAHPAGSSGLDREAFMEEWGVDRYYRMPGGLMQKRPQFLSSGRQVYLLQRKTGKMGESLGKTTGWILRLTLKQRNVTMINAVTYSRIDDEGLHISLKCKPQIIEADTIVICAGQESKRDLKEGLESGGMTVHLIGGAELAVELDAERAIDQGARLAAAI